MHSSAVWYSLYTGMTIESFIVGSRILRSDMVPNPVTSASSECHGVSRATEAFALVSALGVRAVATTYPLIRGLTAHLAGGVGDPLLNAWILAWDADRLRHGLVGIWDAPSFFPYRHTLLYSEHLLGLALFTAPVQWATGNPIF